MELTLKETRQVYIVLFFLTNGVVQGTFLSVTLWTQTATLQKAKHEEFVMVSPNLNLNLLDFLPLVMLGSDVFYEWVLVLLVCQI